MTTRLRISFGTSVLEVDGQEPFVKLVYDDFKELLRGKIDGQSSEVADEDGSERAPHGQPLKARKSKSTTRRTPTNADGPKIRVGDYSPKFDSSLNLATLEGFYDQFEPKNHPEKILIFATYLRDELKRSPCSADDIYSCYRTVKAKTKIPEAFVQALRDAENKAGFIRYESPEKVELSIAGENYFGQKLKRRGNE